MPIPTAERPHFYGRRSGRRPRQQRRELVAERLPDLQLPDPLSLEASIDPTSLFDDSYREIWMEIGFGAGEHLAGQAQQNPDVGIIGCEPFFDGVASLVRHVAERELTNVRIHSDDSRPLLYRMANASLDRAFLLFPDPWRKRRHAERRFIGPKNLDLMARLLKDGAEFRVASDHMPYIDWTLMHVMPHPAFEWTAERPGDWMTQPEDWVPTRYEQKAIRQGRRPVYLSFRRKVRDANDQG